MKNKILPELFTPLELSKIRWKSQVYTHIFFGFWISMLVAYSWNIGTTAILITAALYFALYIFIYIPLFAFLPHLTLKPILPELKRIKNGDQPTEAQAEKMIVFLLGLPRRAIIENVFVTMSAYILGSILWLLNVIPELQNIIHVVIFQTLFLGLIIAITEAFYNYAFVQEKVYASIKYLVDIHPSLSRKLFHASFTSLRTKLLISIRGFSISGQMSILLFLATYLTISVSNQQTQQQIVFSLLLVMLLSFINLLLLAPKVANTFTQPLNALTEWGTSVANGNLDSIMTIKTTDELAEVIAAGNNMVHSLSKDRKNLAKQQNTLEAIIDGIVDSVIAIDSKNKIIFANEQTGLLFGLDVANIIHTDAGTKIAVFDSSNNDVTYRIFSKTDKQIARSELRLVDAKGQSKFVNIINTPISSDSDETAYVIAIHDITKEQEFEQMKVDFVSMAAHELRTPLTSLTGYLATLQEEMVGFSEDHQLFVNRSFESAQQLMDLVDDLLSISRIERGVLKLEKTPTDWEELLSEVVRDSSRLAMDKNISIKITEPQVPLPKVSVDRARIKEIFHNLISNAIKYSPKETTIVLNTERKENDLITHITDHGIGIPKNSIGKLFSKFYRVSASGKDAHSGTGLGLYISKAIIEMHKGEIWVDSQVGKGSTFSFCLPLITSS